MHRFYIDTERLLSESMLLNREECRHLKNVLRLQAKDEIELFDGMGLSRKAVIESVEKNSVIIRPASEADKHPKPQCSITLFSCISKGKRMDWTVEKATELGVSAIVPVISDRTIVRLTDVERKDKAERWKRVAADALRQCGGTWMPDVHEPVDFADALKFIPDRSPVFTAALSEDAISIRDALKQLQTPPVHAGWFVGPEGDFTEKEMELLRNAGTKFVNLGRNVLRAETAAVYGLCVLGCMFNSC